MMQCPDCGGAMWDNRQTKKKPNQPDYKCKNKACDKAVWLDPKGTNGGGNAGKGANGAGSVRSTRPLGPLYFACLQIAAESVKRVVPNATAQDIIAATATLFIGATNTGAPLRQAKAKPAPPPPPPAAAQEPDDTSFDNFEEDLGALPF